MTLKFRLHDNADALSRYSYDDLSIAALSTDKSQSTEISELQQRDLQISPIVTYKISGELQQDEKEAHTILLESDQYYLSDDNLLYNI